MASISTNPTLVTPRKWEKIITKPIQMVKKERQCFDGDSIPIPIHAMILLFCYHLLFRYPVLAIILPFMQ